MKFADPTRAEFIGRYAWKKKQGSLELFSRLVDKLPSDRKRVPGNQQRVIPPFELAAKGEKVYHKWDIASCLLAVNRVKSCRPYLDTDLLPTDDRETVDARYRALAAKLHPDHGGDAAAFADLSRAIKKIRADLAGENQKTAQVQAREVPQLNNHREIA